MSHRGNIIIIPIAISKIAACDTLVFDDVEKQVQNIAKKVTNYPLVFLEVEYYYEAEREILHMKYYYCQVESNQV